MNWVASFRNRNVGHNSLRKDRFSKAEHIFFPLLVISSASEDQPFMEEVMLEHNELVTILSFPQHVVTPSNC